MEHEVLTNLIIGAAYDVAKKLGYGFLESVYENCMAIEVAKRGLKVEQQRRINVFYEGQVVGEYVADLVVDDRIIVELKSIRALLPIHEAQLVNYLSATGTHIGLLINFSESKVEVKRKYRRRFMP